MENYKNVLILEKRGCNFWKNDIEANQYSDIGNYRVFFKGITEKKTKRILWADLSNGFLYESGKPIHHHQLSCTSYEINPFDENIYIENPREYGNIEIDKKARKSYHYTKKDILKFINSISDFKIQDIFIFESFYNKIEEIAGYREKIVLNLCNKIELIMDTSDHLVFRLHAPATTQTEEKYFDYDAKTNRIVG